MRGFPGGVFGAQRRQQGLQHPIVGASAVHIRQSCGNTRRELTGHGKMYVRATGGALGGPEQLDDGGVESGGVAEADAHLTARLEDFEKQPFELGRAGDVECSFKANEATCFIVFEREAHAMLFIGFGEAFREGLLAQSAFGIF